jgi:hypothetical protein
MLHFVMVLHITFMNNAVPVTMMSIQYGRVCVWMLLADLCMSLNATGCGVRKC